MHKAKDCNIDLLDDVVHNTKESSQTVRSVVNFFSSFIADTIKEGAFESVIVPHFGKFQPKTKEIQWRMHYKGVEKGGPIQNEQQDKLIQQDGIIQNNGEL